ncbi:MULTISPECIES: FAD-dependent monooxygenase [Streptomyces]|uniref:FAD-dependent monooxygenase n=1 Tax=Streptomyces TaxID=1883 RepID=UPI00236830E5|nr:MULTISPECIES: FAD-dependent monooxygenase [Streptomyces]
MSITPTDGDADEGRGAPFGTDVLIVGAGPVGPAPALDLGHRGVRFLLLGASDGRVEHPKVGTVGPRSMELFRRWGLAHAIRTAGRPGDHPLDVAWVTHLPRTQKTPPVSTGSTGPAPRRHP